MGSETRVRNSQDTAREERLDESLPSHGNVWVIDNLAVYGLSLWGNQIHGNSSIQGSLQANVHFVFYVRIPGGSFELSMKVIDLEIGIRRQVPV